VIDREGMAAAFLARLAEADCNVVTVLRADQYAAVTGNAPRHQHRRHSAIDYLSPRAYERRWTVAGLVA